MCAVAVTTDLGAGVVSPERGMQLSLVCCLPSLRVNSSLVSWSATLPLVRFQLRALFCASCSSLFVMIFGAGRAGRSGALPWVCTYENDVQRPQVRQRAALLLWNYVPCVGLSADCLDNLRSLCVVHSWFCPAVWRVKTRALALPICRNATLCRCSVAELWCCCLNSVQLFCSFFAGLLQAESAGREVYHARTRTHVRLNNSKYDPLLMCRCCVID